MSIFLHLYPAPAFISYNSPVCPGMMNIFPHSSVFSFVVILRQIRKQNPKIIPSAIENTVNVHVLPIHTVKNHVISTGEKLIVAFYICHRGQQRAGF